MRFLHKRVTVRVARCFIPCLTGVFIMRKHLTSFIKSPIGYAFNFIAHFNGSRFVCWGCETFCLNDGVQDDCWW